MYHINEIELDFEPRNSISEAIPELSADIKMYEPDSAFLCGLLKKFKPRKILEIGVWHGGSTAVILQCMQELGNPFSLHSVDVLEKISDSSPHEIGYIGTKASKLLSVENFHLYRGVYYPQVASKIGGDIDFVVLDAGHNLPGELLEFLVIFPRLSPNAVVCLHDIRLNHKFPPSADRIAPVALFNSVVAEKYVNADDTRKPEYPNIGAFAINDDTCKYINNAIGALTQTWTIMPDDDVFEKYNAIIREHYPEESVWLYDNAVSLNIKTFENSSLSRTATKVVKKLQKTFNKKEK